MSSMDEPDGTPTKRAQSDDLVAYEDDGALILCDRTNPNAWIRSTVTVPVSSSRRSQPQTTGNPRTRNPSDR